MANARAPRRRVGTSNRTVAALTTGGFNPHVVEGVEAPLVGVIAFDGVDADVPVGVAVVELVVGVAVVEPVVGVAVVELVGVEVVEPVVGVAVVETVGVDPDVTVGEIDFGVGAPHRPFEIEIVLPNALADMPAPLE